MPARLFRVHLINDTGCSLRRMPGHSLEGEFTSGDWTPPDTIPAHQERGWQSESDGILQGTEGWETYEIEDGSPVPDQVRLHWVNPYWTMAVAHLSLLTSTGTFEDRAPAEHQDPSSSNPEYAISKGYKLEGMMPQPMGSYPGHINSDGWLEIVPGTLLALPIPLGTIDHCWTMFRLTERSGQESMQFGPRAGTQSLVFVPALNAPAQAWEETFVYPSGEAGSAEVLLQIQRSAQNSRYVMARLRGTAFQVALTERPSQKRTAPITVNQEGVFVTQAEDLIYRLDLWPPRPSYTGGGILQTPGELQNAAGGVQAAQPVMGSAGAAASSIHVAGSLSQAASQAASTFSRDGLEVSGGGGAGGGNGIRSPYSGDLTVAQHLALQQQSIKLTEAADCLRLPFNITLMLYSVHLENGQPLGYSVRYLRHSDSGARLVDVMLLPALETIR